MTLGALPEQEKSQAVNQIFVVPIRTQINTPSVHRHKVI